MYVSLEGLLCSDSDDCGACLRVFGRISKRVNHGLQTIPAIVFIQVAVLVFDTARAMCNCAAIVPD